MNSATDPWARLPGEPATDYAIFLDWATTEPYLDLGDFWRARIRPRPLISRPDLAAIGDLSRRWGWEVRAEAYRGELQAARAAKASKLLARERAAAAALEFSELSVAVAVQKARGWRQAPGTVPDSLALGLASEHRQRQRDSGEIVRTADVVPAPPAHAARAAAFDDCSEEEIQALERAAAIVAKHTKKPLQ